LLTKNKIREMKTKAFQRVFLFLM